MTNLVRSFFALALGLSACTASNPGHDSASVSCAFAGIDACATYSKLTTPEKTATTATCGAQSGRVVDSCPAGYLGCCQSTLGGFTTTECFYDGDAAQLAQACQGAWSTSGFDAGGVEHGPDLGLKGGPDASGGECTSGEVVCPKGCANLQTDANNCGSCGYACPGGQGSLCSAGKCVVGGTSTCSEILACYVSATTSDAQQACIMMGSPTAQLNFLAALNCVADACGLPGGTVPDMGTSPCNDNQADCASCVQSGTSTTNQSIGTCANSSATPVSSDPLCGRCVDPLLTCRNG